MISAYIIHLLILIVIYSLVISGLNFAVGYTGLLNLGHVAFFAIGAYTSALLTMAGVPLFFAMIAAGILPAILSFFLIYATKRLKGDYFALATLGFGFIVHSIILNWVSLTKGPIGLIAIPRPNIFGYVITSNILYLLFAAIICAALIFVLYKILKSPFGRLMEGTRDNELALRVLGKNTSLIKIKVLAISAFVTGIAGSLYAHYVNYLDPSVASITEIIFVFTILIIGGIASLKGSVVATAVLIIIPELLRFLAIPSTVLGPLRQIIYAILLIGILLFRPRGLFGRIDLE